MGWRGLTNTSVAFPFGHGLGFARFEYHFAAATTATGSIAKIATADPSAVTWTSVVSAAARGPATHPLINMSVTIRNRGPHGTAREVAQLYVKFPPEAGEPPLLLRGFSPTQQLAVGQTARLPFVLTRRDLSVWQPAEAPASGAWRLVGGRFGVCVGASSRDLRACGTLEVRVEI